MSNRLNDEPKKQVKMRIKAFTTTMEESYLNSIWNMLKNAIHEIQKKNNGGLSFEELYRNAYTMVLHKHGEKLYTGLREVVSEHLTNKVFVDVSSARYHNFLSTLNAAWTDHQTAMVMIRDILMYMDRVYVMQTQGVEPVYNLGLILFRDKIVRAPPIRNCLRCAMMTMIHKERNGLLIDRSALKNACQMLLIIGIDSRNVYVEDFEKYFLSTTANFYKQESQVYLALNDAAAYLRKVDIRIEEERERVLNVLCKHTEPKLMEVLERELIINHMRSILEMENSGIYQMLQNDDIEDLSCLYKLFRRVPDGCQAIADCISSYLKQQGKNLMGFEESGTDKIKISITLIRGLLELRQRFDKILQDAFGNDLLFKMAMSSSFESFINVSSRIPEYLSLFIDDLLRKGSKTSSETELEQVIDRVMVLFRYIQEKDAFERYYKLHLSKRLLLGKSFNDDCERRVVLKLKSECGCHFTNKLEGMFRDIAVSDITMEDYKHFQEDNEVHLPVDFTCRILTTGFWPTQGDESPCNLPESLNYVFNTFEHFYSTKHNGRQLTLQHSLGSADINASFFLSNNTTRKFIFQVNTYQMCILLLFNSRDSWTFEEILQETEIRKKDLARALSGLCSASKSHQKVLIKTPAEGCNLSDKIEINENFASKCVRVKISPGAPVKDSKEDASLINDTQKRIDEDRKHEIEAAIVRIMKARKRMNHSQLMSEITSQLKSRFMPDPVVVKKRIENLIERDYIYRNDDDMKVYTYRA